MNETKCLYCGCCDPDGWCRSLCSYLWEIKECTATEDEIKKESLW